MIGPKHLGELLTTQKEPGFRHTGCGDQTSESIREVHKRVPREDLTMSQTDCRVLN